MSDPLEHDVPDFRPRRRRLRIVLLAIGVVIAAFFLITVFTSLYTERLWYRSVGYSSVYSTIFWTRVGLFAGFGLVMAGAVAGSMVVAYRTRPFHRPDSPEQTGLDRYRDAVTPIRTLLLVSVAGVIGLFGGVAANGRWRTFLLWANREPFHVQDPYFHKDVGFYVFTLPWLHFIVGYLIAVLVLAAIAAVIVHYLYGGIRLQGGDDRMSTAATVQLSVLVGLALLVKAVGYWLDRYDLVTSSGRLVTGMSYTDQHAVWPARNILVGVALICALLFLLTAWRRNWLMPVVGVSLLVITSVLLGLIWPAIVQRFQVDPAEQAKEAPYLKANIDATRDAYDLQDIRLEKVPSQPATAATVQQLIDATPAVPVVDPKWVQGSFTQSQIGQPYYQVKPVPDVDHYMVDGVDREVVIAARELYQAGIATGSQNWSNLHTVYTHGSGIIAAFSNQRPSDNSEQTAQVQWAQGLQPDQKSLESSTGSFQPRIYFGMDSPSYSIVGAPPGTPPSEVDLTPDGLQSRTTYDGDGGVPVSSFFNKLMYAIKFGDSNFLLSNKVGPDSQVLYDRSPLERVEKVAPWLTLDGDVYPAVVDHRILWIVDGYTTTDQYPQSERTSLSAMTSDSLSTTTETQPVPNDEINYIRNSVKATVDAYTGKVTLYAWDPSDPILQAWRSAFPGTVESKSQIPPQLLAHLRYPEDMFKVQRYQYQRYHVTDPNNFYQQTNTWQVAFDPTVSDKEQYQAPIRMFISGPQGSQVWSMTSTYVPRNKANLVGFLHVDSDATSPAYGTLQVDQPPGDNTQGPGQAFQALTSNTRILRKTQTFKLGDATPRYGNLVPVPLGGGIMYVEPVYATRTGSVSASSYALRYVMVSYGNYVGIGDTLVHAIMDMASQTAPPPQQQHHTHHGHQKVKDPRARAHALLEQAQRDFAAADKAFADGHAVAWNRLNHKAREEVARALNLLS